MERLLDVLRTELGLTGAKEGCGEGECGSCSVLMNGALVNSCLVPVLQAQGATLCTIEGLARDGVLHPVQKAFLKCGGAQCGICTPGMVMATVHLLRRNPFANPGSGSRRAGRKPVPLHRLYAHLSSGVGSGADRFRDMRAQPSEYELVAPGKLSSSARSAGARARGVAADRRRHRSDGAVRRG